MAFIAVDNYGERSIYTSMGANSSFKLEKEDINYINESKILHVTGMYKEVVEEATKHTDFLSFNPGAALSAFGIRDLKEIIKRANILFLNKKEVSTLTGEYYHEGAKNLVDMGVPLVVVTCGGHGACIYTPDKIIHSPTIKTESLDTTGAGDAFAAGFIEGVIKNKELNKCLQMGNKSACTCLGRLGAVNIPHH
jgi:ribokinase